MAATGAVLLMLGTVAIAALHPLESSLDPMVQPLSKYAMTGGGWLFDAGVLVLALGLGAVLYALVLGRSVAPSSSAVPVMIASCIGLVIVVIFPDETSGRTFTATGWAHWVAAMFAFGALPLGPVLIARHHRRVFGCSCLPAAARLLSFVAGFWFVLLMVGSLLEVVTLLPVWRVGGLVERSLASTEVATALVLAVWAWRGCGCKFGLAGTAPPPEQRLPEDAAALARDCEQRDRAATFT